jgi:hypothetical protein
VRSLPRSPFNVPALTCVIAALGALHAAPAAGLAGEPVAAEFAIRWNAAGGGPRSGSEAVTLLRARMRAPKEFAVDYFDLPPETPVPAGHAAILRRRVAPSGRAELTWKLRGERALATWSCPLRDASRSQAEVDITLGEGDNTTRRYSTSCSSEYTDAEARRLAATPRACAAKVTRWERAGLKVEEWRLPGGAVVIEVSRGATDTPAALAAFRRDIAIPLLAAGIAPLVGSKTELGSACP